jgi:hypothetical protein
MTDHVCRDVAMQKGVGAKGLTETALTTATVGTGVNSGLLVTPYTVVVDNREQQPFVFTGLRGDAIQGQRNLLVRTVTRCLPAGDYSLAGFERQIAVERKSLFDLFHTLGQSRARFSRELLKLSSYEFSAVVVEADWGIILGRPPPRSRLNPKTIFRSVIAWQQLWPRIHWWMLPGRNVAEVTCLRILERFWKRRADPTKTGHASETRGSL